ncbi:hypothetical protein [Fredinandcohnia sp. 179-A 10B2 NHS]|uniref:hypothetical protein n=1 Tax=Fredinandcohnia sp. 179-A 10B2 NHS TaxID=3235176 RepID=UPI0039A30FC6
MPMEPETMGMLTSGFTVVMAITFIVVLSLFISKRNKPFRVAYGFIVGFLVVFSLAIYQALQALRFDVNHPMASEEISLRLGVAGLLWAISMLFLVSGLLGFSFNKNKALTLRRQP